MGINKKLNYFLKIKLILICNDIRLIYQKKKQKTNFSFDKIESYTLYVCIGSRLDMEQKLQEN